MTTLEQISQNIPPFAGGPLDAVHEFSKYWGKAVDIAQAPVRKDSQLRDSIAIAAVASLRELKSWDWTPSESLREMFSVDTQNVPDWTSLLRQMQSAENVDYRAFWKSKSKDIFEEVLSAASAAKELSKEPNADVSAYASAFKALVTECLALTILVAPEAKASWTDIVADFEDL